MAQNIGLVVVEIWSLCLLVFALHHMRSRYGLTLLLGLTVMFSILVQTPAIAVNFIAVTDHFYIFLGSSVLVPVILIAVLITYVLEGTFVARQFIYGVLGVTVLSVVITKLFLLNVRLPGGGNWLGIPPDDAIFGFGLRTTIASFLAFTVDLYVIAIVYQAITNHLPRIPRWIGAGVSLLVAVCGDSILYSTISYGFTLHVFADLCDDLLAKLAAAVIAWPLLAIYISWYAPRYADIASREKRPTFELLFGSIAKLETALHEAEQTSQRIQEDMLNLRSYIGDASHDLKHPLTVIKLRLHQLMASDNEALRRENVGIIQQQTHRLEKMIEDLLVLSRLDEIEEPVTEPAELNQVVQTATEALQACLAEKGQSLEMRLAESLPQVQINVDDVVRAITNLLENAIRYTPDRGRIEVETRAGKSEAIIQIRDTGIGIAETDLPHIFDRFYRSETAVESNISGTGLGLAIVKKVVDKHGGHIEVNSVLNEGTTFFIHLPCNPNP